MAKKRSCRRTEEEDRQHELAVKVRKMTDKQIADLLESKEVIQKHDPEKIYTQKDLDEAFVNGHKIGKDEMRKYANKMQKQVEQFRSQMPYTRAQIRSLPKDQQAAAKAHNNSLLSTQQVNKIKKQTTSDVSDRAFGMALAIMVNVLAEDYWKKTYKKKLPDFVKKCLDLKMKVDKKTVYKTIDEIKNICDVDLMKVKE